MCLSNCGGNYSLTLTFQWRHTNFTTCQGTGKATVCSTSGSGLHQTKHQTSAWLILCKGSAALEARTRNNWAQVTKFLYYLSPEFVFVDRTNQIQWINFPQVCFGTSYFVQSTPKRELGIPQAESQSSRGFTLLSYKGRQGKLMWQKTNMNMSFMLVRSVLAILRKDDRVTKMSLVLALWTRYAGSNIDNNDVYVHRGIGCLLL